MQLANDSPSISAENAAQIVGGLGENAAPIHAKPLKGKYDGRGKYDRSKTKWATGIKPGPKPQYLQRLSRNASSKVLEMYAAIASLEAIYREAWEKRDLRLCVEMQENAANRAYGKPYTATPPDNGKPGWQDNRLQVAIQNLNIGQSGTKQLKGSKSQRNKGESLTIPPSKLLETKATSDKCIYVNQTTTDGQGTSDDAGQPGQDGIAE